MAITSGFIEHGSSGTATKFVIFTGSSAQSYTLVDAAHYVASELVLKLQGSGVVTINAFGSQLIDGAASYSLAAQYNAVRVVSDGSNWSIIAKV